MAQETTTSSPVENPQGDTVYTQILQRLQEYERKAAQDAVIIQRLQEEQAKRKAEKEKEEKQKQDQKNVVKKLPTVLTTNERKRYSEIGKRFLLGAEQQFRQIQKGIKTKQMMKTSKDYFLKGFEKIKEQKEKTKKKSFWKILLGSLVVIGAAAFLFRDKIAKMMPDLSEKTGGIFNTIKNYLGNMIKGCWDYITKSLGGSITAIFQRIFTESIPSILQVLFFHTLPNAIFNTYLAIMSQFDPRANEILGSGAHDPQTLAAINAATAKGGELDRAAPEESRQIDAAQGAITGVLKVFDKIQKNEKVTQEEISLMQSTLGRWMLMGNANSVEVTNQIRAIYQGAQGLLGTWAKGQFSKGALYQLMSDGTFDWQQFLRRFLSSDRTAEAMGMILKDMFSRVKTKDQIDRLKKLGLTFDNNGNLVIYDKHKYQEKEGRGSRFLSNPTLTGGDNKFTKAAEYYSGMQSRLGAQWGGIPRDDNRVLSAINRVQEDRLGYMYDGMGYVSLQLLRDATVAQVNNFAKSIDAFISQGGIIGDFKVRIKNMVQGMSNFFNQFFIGSLQIMKNVLYGILTYTNTNPNENNKNSKTSTIIQNQGGVLINVDLTGNEAISIAEAFSEIGKTQESIISHIQSSIDCLQKINTTLNDIKNLHGFSKNAFQTVVADLHTVKDNYQKSDAGILKKVNENTKAIQTLQKTTKSPFAWLAPPLQSQADRENVNSGR